MNTLATFCKKVGVPVVTPHCLRHTCAALLPAAGVQPHVVQRRLGHRSIEITLNLYSHVLPYLLGRKLPHVQIETLRHRTLPDAIDIERRTVSEICGPSDLHDGAAEHDFITHQGFRRKPDALGPS